VGAATEEVPARMVHAFGPRFLRHCPFLSQHEPAKTPKFLSGRDQFTEGEVSSDRRICKLRYTCEVAFSRVTKTEGLRDVISLDFFHQLDDMNDWAHATINLDKPLMK